jgi:uncharacterized cupredoxin-like copper-binding protein
MLHRSLGAIALLLLATLLTGCAPEAEGATAIQVTLDDSTIDVARNIVATGRTALEIHNEGTTVHEVEVFSGAADGQILPVRSSVADTTGLTLIDEVENILAESNASLVIDLEPGTYLLICNLPEHYNNGMWSYVMVEEVAG